MILGTATENVRGQLRVPVSGLVSRANTLFFFQAEDGIRDGRVTGVQTCALPIFARRKHEELGDVQSVGGAVVVGAAAGGAPTPTLVTEADALLAPEPPAPVTPAPDRKSVV